MDRQMKTGPQKITGANFKFIDEENQVNRKRLTCAN